MKLKTLVRTADAVINVYLGKFESRFESRSATQFVGKVGSLGNAGFYGCGGASRSQNMEWESRVSEMLERTINKMYVNSQNEIVVYVW